MIEFIKNLILTIIFFKFNLHVKFVCTIIIFVPLWGFYALLAIPPVMDRERALKREVATHQDELPLPDVSVILVEQVIQR